MDDVFNSDLNGEIIISPHNKMRSTFGIIRVGESDLDSILQIGHEALLESELTVRVSDSDDLDSAIDVKYLDSDDLNSSISVRVHNDLEAFLEVPVWNEMVGVFNIIDPPRETVSLSAIKDAYVRSDAPALNYGRERTMIAGSSSDGQASYWSLLQFEDVRETISQNLIIESAKIKLYFDENVNDLPKLILDTINGYWEETDVTWYKRPMVGDYHLDKYEINEEEKYVEFDVTDIILDIHSSSMSIDGFYIRRDESDARRLASFGTRERNDRNPELNVIYYNPDPHSDGRAEVHGSIEVKYPKSFDLDASLEVHSDWGWDDLDSEIFVVYPKERIGEIIVNKGNLPSEITARRSGKKDIDGEIEVKKESWDLRDGVIIVNKGIIPSQVEIETPKKYNYSELNSTISIYIRNERAIAGSITVNKGILDSFFNIRRKGQHDLPSTLDVVFAGGSNLESSLIVNKGTTPSVIVIQKYSDLELEITINKKSLPSEIDVVRSDSLESSITVKKYGHLQINGEIQVGHDGDKDVISSLTVTKEKLPCEIIVRKEEEEDLESNLTVRRESHSKIESILIVRRELLHSEIEVLERSDLESNLTIRREEWHDVDGEIYVLFRDDLESEIDVAPISEIECSIEIYSQYLKGVIIIPYEDHEDIEGSIIARVRWADDLTSSIVVYSDSMSGGYYYIL